MSTLASAAETDAVLADFAAEVGSDDPVAVVGGDTRPVAGGPLDPEARLISAPAGVVQYRPSEMTVQVRAGTTVAALHDELAEAGQRTALAERGGTVGGAVAVGENHLDMLGRGRVRDAVLQVRYVSADQKLVTGGGPVVKNVSGFNLPKLITGSLGTLGLLAEVVLRTSPIPAMSLWLRAAAADPTAVRDALLRPSAVLTDGTATWVHLEGYEADVIGQTARLRGLGDFAETAGPPPLPPHRWSLTPREAAEADPGAVGGFVAVIGVGVVFAQTAQPPRPVDPGAAVVAARLKALFDPSGRLNPGRMPGA